MTDVICGAPSLWPGVVCEKAPHEQDRHEAEDFTSLYVWSTAAVEAEKRGDCPGCLRRICACPCCCDMCTSRKAAR